MRQLTIQILALSALRLLTACTAFSGLSSGLSSVAAQSSSAASSISSTVLSSSTDASSNSGTGNGNGTAATAAAPAITVMPMGDSNTYGAVAQSYREALSNYMGASSVPVQFVGSQIDGRDSFKNNAHEGYSGWAADDLLNGMSGLYPMDSVTKLQPKYILLMAGTNDFLVKKYSVAQATQNIQNLIAEIQRRSPNSKIIVATVFPIVDTSVSPRQGYPNINDQVTSYNNNLKSMIPTNFGGGKLMLLDMNSFVDFDWLYDGVHANALGYVAVAQAWYSVLAPLVATDKAVAQPACVANPASRAYIMASLRFFAAAYAIPRLSTDAATFTANINTGIGTLITTNWACQDTTNVANYVSVAVSYIQGQ